MLLDGWMRGRMGRKLIGGWMGGWAVAMSSYTGDFLRSDADSDDGSIGLFVPDP